MREAHGLSLRELLRESTKKHQINLNLAMLHKDLRKLSTGSVDMSQQPYKRGMIASKIYRTPLLKFRIVLINSDFFWGYGYHEKQCESIYLDFENQVTPTFRFEQFITLSYNTDAHQVTPRITKMRRKILDIITRELESLHRGPLEYCTVDRTQTYRNREQTIVLNWDGAIDRRADLGKHLFRRIVMNLVK